MARICVVTGTRADYGLLYPLMKALKANPRFDLQVLATGMHLSPEFGLTYRQIEADGFVIDEKVEMLLSADTSTAIVKATGLGMIGYADALVRLKPDAMVVLGDRFEAFAAATAAYLSRIPVLHLHGGELTEGASDDALRHAISKMSYLHFTAAEEYRQRVIQLGEDPSRVFNIGALGLDNIKKMRLLSREDLERQLSFTLDKPVLAVTYHPVTLENDTAGEQMEQLLSALDHFREDVKVVFTLPNADADGRIIADLIHHYHAQHPENTAVFTSLGQLRYLSLLRHAAAVVGNSSSGIIEAPSFGIPTVDIGDRQKGRLRAHTVLHSAPDAASIIGAIGKALDPAFSESCRHMTNPYGDGEATSKLMTVLEQTPFPGALKKAFFDLHPTGK